MNPSQRQPGFALLISLVLVLIAGVVLAGVARRSMLDAVQTRSNVEELQRHWATISLQETLLPRVEAILQTAERPQVARRDNEPQTAVPHPKLTIHCRLNDIDYELILTDEQSKLNANSLAKGSGPNTVQRQLDTLIRQAVTDRTKRRKVNPRPLPGTESTTPFGGFDQLFESLQVEALLARQRSLGLSDVVTLWGNGMVHAHRSSPAVIRTACTPKLPDDTIDQFINTRDTDRSLDLAGILAKMDDLDDKQMSVIPKLLTESSTCHGLWIIANGDLRSWHTLTIGEGGGSGTITQRYNFAW